MEIVKEGPRWVCRCTFIEKDQPKAAGFRWDPAKRQWWTPDAEKAAKLSSPEEAGKLMEQVAAKQMLRCELIDDSRQADTDYIIPCPEGLEYLPFQKAGIVSALRRCGFDLSLLPRHNGSGENTNAQRNLSENERNAQQDQGEFGEGPNASGTGTIAEYIYCPSRLSYLSKKTGYCWSLKFTCAA